MSVDDINPVNQYQTYRPVHLGHGPQRPPRETGAPADPEPFVNPYTVTSNTGPSSSAGSAGTAHPGRNASYALLLFQEFRTENMAEILNAFTTSSGTGGLSQQFDELGAQLAAGAIEKHMGANIYHLGADGKLADSHAAEGVNLEEFRRDDGTFDMASALAEMTLVREGERSPQARETEASYFDSMRQRESDGTLDALTGSFANLAVKGALGRAARDVPGFADAYANDPGQAVRDYLHPLTNYLMNTAVTNEFGTVRAYF